MNRAPLKAVFAALAIVVLAVLPAIVSSNYLVGIAISGLIFTTVAASLNLI